MLKKFKYWYNNLSSCYYGLTFTTLLANSADDKLVIIFSYFSQKIDFDISCKLSPAETICIKCQSLFSGEKSVFWGK